MCSAFREPPWPLDNLPQPFNQYRFGYCGLRHRPHACLYAELSPASLESSRARQFSAEPLFHADVLYCEMHPRQSGRRPGRNEDRPGEVYLSIASPTTFINFSRGRSLANGQNKCRKFYLWRRPLRKQRRRCQGLVHLPSRRPSGYVHQYTTVR